MATPNSLLEFLLDEEPVSPFQWMALMRTLAVSAAVIAGLVLVSALLYEPLVLPALERVYAAGVPALRDWLRGARWPSALAVGLWAGWIPAVLLGLRTLRRFDLTWRGRWLLHRMRPIMVALPVLAVFGAWVASRGMVGLGVHPALHLYLANRVVAFGVVMVVLVGWGWTIRRVPYRYRNGLWPRLSLDDTEDVINLTCIVQVILAAILLPCWYWAAALVIVFAALAGGSVLAHQLR